MIHKRIHPANLPGMLNTVNLIGAHSRGLDTTHLKEASAGEFMLNLSVKPKKGKSYVHLVTLGAGEYYGSNTNADFFNKKACQVSIPQPKTHGKHIITLDGGLEKYHKTFMKYGGVYREHYNSKKGGKSLGNIVAEAFNPDMHRGELIVELDNDEWSSSLDKLASNQPIYFSMGAGVKYDICSICGNEARTRSEYCNHMRNQKNEILKEGHQVFAYNDAPHLHDISEVLTPADKIAFGLRKVASAGGTQFMQDRVSDLWMPLSLIDKLASETESVRAHMLDKLAEMEKRILAQGMTTDEKNVSDSFCKKHIPEEIAKKMDGMPLETVLSSLHNEKIMLPPKAFVRIVMKQPIEDVEGIDGLEPALQNIFSSLKEEDGVAVLSDGSYTPPNGCSGSGLGGLTSDLTEDHSLKDEPLSKRIIKVSVNGPHVSHKTASSLEQKLRGTSPAAGYLAKEYAKYQISFASHPGNATQVHLAVLSNKALLN